MRRNTSCTAVLLLKIHTGLSYIAIFPPLIWLGGLSITLHFNAFGVQSKNGIMFDPRKLLIETLTSFEFNSPRIFMQLAIYFPDLPSHSARVLFY